MVRLGMHCKVEKIGVDPMSISPFFADGLSDTTLIGK